MAENNEQLIVFVDTSYLTRMPWAERVNWNKLLEHARKCVTNLDTKPRLEIHISEISLREFRGKMIDEFNAEIDKTRGQINKLNKAWQQNDLAKQFEYPFPRDEDLFPAESDIDPKADLIIKDFLNGGIKRIEMKDHHNDAVLEKYFGWKPPFDVPNISDRAQKDVREKRRTHIPDAWILEAAIDAKNAGYSMLCLCKDGNLSSALKEYNHTVFDSAKEVLELLFPPAPIENSVPEFSEDGESETDEKTPLDRLLSKSLDSKMNNIYLRLLGFVGPLDTPSHDTLFSAVESKGYDRNLVEACAVMLSNGSNPYIIDTGSHYIVGNKDICDSAADRLTQEIIDMLELMD